MCVVANNTDHFSAVQATTRKNTQELIIALFRFVDYKVKK
jgi:hypothetical protein